MAEINSETKKKSRIHKHKSKTISLEKKSTMGKMLTHSIKKKEGGGGWGVRKHKYTALKFRHNISNDKEVKIEKMFKVLKDSCI